VVGRDRQLAKAFGAGAPRHWNCADLLLGYYKNPETIRALRKRASTIFLSDYRTHSERYVAGELPNLSFAEGTLI
jgi:hypothetical protein